MKKEEIKNAVEGMRRYYRSGETLDVGRRLIALAKLREAIREMEPEINAALKADLNKGAAETYMCETGMVLAEISHVMKHLRSWNRTHYVRTHITQLPATSFTVRDPYGVVLIMSPWNYPFMLTMDPLVGAIAGGNCVALKPSAYSPATSAVMAKLIERCFPAEWVSVTTGGREENTALLDEKFDYIFFTGGVNVGKEVMRHAAENLTPVTLELGGKSPVIIDKTAKLRLAARRLVFGKLLNCGQTCIAPDYVLIDKSVKDEFLGFVKECIEKQYGKNVMANEAYVHMISRKHFDRVTKLIDPAKVVYGGHFDPETLAIEPTVLDHVTPEDAVMQEEIFGPILPILTFDKVEDAIEFVNNRPHPLALYLFSEDKALQKRVVKTMPFGGGCINDTIMHIVSTQMAFGGVGNSGMGSYHGKKSFDTFTHEKSVLSQSTKIDMPIRYAPYTSLQEKMVKFFLR